MRRTSRILGGLGILMLGLTFAAQAIQPSEIQQKPLSWKQVAMGDGGQLYAELCATCHGARATGNGPAAAALATPVPDLSRLALRNGGVFPAAEVRQVIAGETRVAAHGELGMPRWETSIQDTRPDIKPSHREGFARLRIQDLTDYLATLQVQELR